MEKEVFGDGAVEKWSYKRAQKRKRGMRRLVGRDLDLEASKRFRSDISKSKGFNEECQKSVVVFACILLSVLTALVFGNCFLYENRIGEFIANFINNYEEHFHQIVHGRQNYCSHRFDTSALTTKILREELILHQKNALLDLQLAMDIEIHPEKSISIALVGPVGVGKTLYVNALQKHFPWPENMHAYVWNRFVRNDREKLQYINQIVENFSECGINLLIIKNLTPADRNVIKDIAAICKRKTKERKLRVIAIFVVNLNTMLNEEEYKKDYNSLQELNHTTTVNFKNFGKDELKDCIQREAQLENIILSHDSLEELLDTIDFKRSGCKNVNAKILAYGTKK